MSIQLAEDSITFVAHVCAVNMLTTTKTEEDDTAVLEGKFNFMKTFSIATKYMLMVCFILAIIVGLSYYYLGYSNIPVADYTVSKHECLHMYRNCT